MQVGQSGVGGARHASEQGSVYMSKAKNIFWGSCIKIVGLSWREKNLCVWEEVKQSHDFLSDGYVRVVYARKMCQYLHS